MEILSNIHRDKLVQWAKTHPEAVVLSADLTGSCEADLFRDTYPGRFISAGISEQNMISVAGGLAREGFIPLVHTFSVFIYRRAYDQVAMSVAYPNLPVKLFGFLPGITTPGGATHQAIEDISVMRSLPNMTVLETGDATEVEGILDLAISVKGPVYIRMLRGQIPRLFNKEEPIKLDSPRILSRGNDIVLFSSGICTEEAIRAVAAMKQKGISLEHVHVSTLKPFNSSIIINSLKKAKKGIISMENHTVSGGLGTLLCEKMVEYGISVKLIRLGLKDTFAHGAERHYLLKEYGMDAGSLIKACEELLGCKLGITDTDIADKGIEVLNSSANANESTNTESTVNAGFSANARSSANTEDM